MDEGGRADVPSDGDLARRVSAAGADAAEAEAELLRRLAPLVRLYGLRHLRDTAAADDLVQEVLMLTLERLRAGRVREPDRLASFVLGSCRLVVRNVRRGVKRREALLDRFAAVAEGVPGLVRKGELPTVLLPAVVERLQGEGRRIREYRVRPGGGVQCTVSPDDDVVLARLTADLGGVARLDLVIQVDDGPEQRLPDLAFDPGDDELVFAPSTDWLRSLPAHVERLRLLAVDPQGEKVLGEYTFRHTPWPGA